MSDVFTFALKAAILGGIYYYVQTQTARKKIEIEHDAGRELPDVDAFASAADEVEAF